MCMAVPSRVVSIAGMTAVVECFGERREVSLILMNEDVSLGDYLLVQAGGFAFQRVGKEAAQKTLELLREIITKSAALN